MLKFVWFLPVPQSWASFLHMLTSGLQRLALAATESADREPAMELGGGGGQGNEVRGALEVPVVQLVGSKARRPQQVLGRLTDGVCKTVSRICRIFGVCGSPSLSHTSCASYLSILNGVKKKWVSLAAFCTAEEARLALTFACRGNHGQEGPAWH